MINELDLLWVPNFIALGIYFIFGTKFFWNEGIDTCFNVECVLLDSNFDFLAGYLVVTARYLVVTTRYLVVTARYLVVSCGYCSLLFVSTFSVSGSRLEHISFSIIVFLFSLSFFFFGGIVFIHFFQNFLQSLFLFRWVTNVPNWDENIEKIISRNVYMMLLTGEIFRIACGKRLSRVFILKHAVRLFKYSSFIGLQRY